MNWRQEYIKSIIDTPKPLFINYGRVFRVNPKRLFKKAVILDTVVPLTFFIPVIMAFIVILISRGQEIMINDWRYKE